MSLQISPFSFLFFFLSLFKEIRTPLTSIIGVVELILENPSIIPPDILSQLRIIRNSGLHLLSLVNDILDYSKVEKNALELDMVKFNLREIVESAMNRYEKKGQKGEVEERREIERGRGRG